MPMVRPTNSITLLSKNDWKRIEGALRSNQETVVDITFGDLHERVSTCHVDDSVHKVKILVRVEIWGHGFYSSQYFEKLDDARR